MPLPGGLVLDTAHGHSKGVLDAVATVKRLSNECQVIAGNVATGDGAQALGLVHEISHGNGGGDGIGIRVFVTNHVNGHTLFLQVVF